MSPLAGLMVAPALYAPAGAAVALVPWAALWLQLFDLAATLVAAVVVGIVFLRALRFGSVDIVLGPVSYRTQALREDAVALAVLAYVTAVALLRGLATGIGWREEDFELMLLVGTGGHLLAAVACVVIGGYYCVGGVRAFILGNRTQGSRTSWHSLLLFVLAIGLCQPILDLTVRLWRAFSPDAPLEPHATLQALQSDSIPFVHSALLWVGAALIAPVAEELFFRGLLQNALANVVRSRVSAVVLTAALFGLVHWAYAYTVPALFVLGLLLGFAYERTGSLLPPIAIHALFNFKTLIWDACNSAPAT